MGSETSFIKQTHRLLHQDSVPKLFWSEDSQPSTSSTKSSATHHPTHTICKPLCYYCRIDKFRIPCVSKRELGQRSPKTAPCQQPVSLVPGRQIPDSSRDGVAYPRPLRPLFPTFYRRDISSPGLTACWQHTFQKSSPAPKNISAALTPGFFILIFLVANLVVLLPLKSSCLAEKAILLGLTRSSQNTPCAVGP